MHGTENHLGEFLYQCECGQVSEIRVDIETGRKNIYLDIDHEPDRLGTTRVYQIPRYRILKDEVEQDSKIYVVAAAVRYKGHIYTGRRHADIIKDIVRHDVTAHIYQGDQGFMTNTGNFVNRELAASIAYAAGQIVNKQCTLYSEDIIK
jgi:hypothetical protein